MAASVSRHEGEAKPLCFVVSPIGAEGSEPRKRSDQVYKYIILPAAEEVGFSVQRADGISEIGSITKQLISRVIEADVVVADLTDHNPNVFYELAIRHATGKPYIPMIDRRQDIPFDVNDVRTIFFRHDDLDEADAAKGQLIEYMQKALEYRDSEGVLWSSPVGDAVSFAALKASAPEEGEGVLMARIEAMLLNFEESVMRRVEKAIRGSGVRVRPPALGLYEDLLKLSPLDRAALLDFLSSRKRVGKEDDRALLQLLGKHIDFPDLLEDS